MELQERLKQMPLLKDIEEIDTLYQAHLIQFKKVKKGVTFHEEGEHCQALDLIIEGKLVAYALSENGSETSMFEFLKNQSIGANLLFAENPYYPFNLFAKEETSIATITREGLKVLLHNYSFVLRFLENISGNSQILNQKITIFKRKTLRENLEAYLMSLYKKQKVNPITLPISKKELADYLGVQRPSLFRELKKMQEEGLIVSKNKVVDVCFLKDAQNENT